MRRLPAAFVFLCAALLALGAAAKAPHYRVDYRIGFDPGQGEAIFSMTVTPQDAHVKRLRFRFEDAHHLGFQGDGEIKQGKHWLVWRPPTSGPATLRYRYRIDRERSGGGYDARITSDWTLFRADRLLPPAQVVSPGYGESISTLRFDLPKGWTNADLGYRFDDKRKLFAISNPGRRFHQPVGWVVAGEVGTRRDVIDRMEVSVGAPKGDDMRRNDILAVVNSVALELDNAFGRLPPKLLIVGAGDPMWRGGLSSPNSFYVHSDRPLISENGSSTVVHEMVHVVTRLRGAKGEDWLAEGIAEYYSIEILRRAGLLNSQRAEKALRWMEHHGEKVKSLARRSSAGPRTARAVTLLADLDREIRRATRDERSLDDVARALMGRGRVSLDMLREAAAEVIGREAETLNTSLLDG